MSANRERAQAVVGSLETVVKFSQVARSLNRSSRKLKQTSRYTYRMTLLRASKMKMTGGQDRHVSPHSIWKVVTMLHHAWLRRTGELMSTFSKLETIRRTEDNRITAKLPVSTHR